MTVDHIGGDRGGPSPDGSQGWGFGVGVQLRRTGLAPAVGSYGWAGGLGSSWANDPGKRAHRHRADDGHVHRPLPPAADHPGLLDLHLRGDR